MFKYRSSMAYGRHNMVFEKPNEGNPGGGEPDAAAIAAAKVVADKAAADAETAAAEAAAAEKSKTATDAEKEEAKTAADLASATSAREAELLREVMDKKTKLKDASEQLAAYNGIDPAKVAELMKKETDAELKDASDRGEFDRVKTMMADAHKTEMERSTADLDAMKASMSAKDIMIDKLTLGNDFGSSAFLKNKTLLSTDKARKLYGDHFEVKDGVTVAYDKSADVADRTIMVDSAGKNLSFDEAISKIMDADPDKATMMKVDVLPGGKSNSNPGDSPAAAKKSGPKGAARIAASIKSDFD